MLSPDAAEYFHENGFCFPVPILTEEEAEEVRATVEAFERANPEAIGKLDFKANLLFPWLDRLTRHPNVIGALEPILGEDILCHGVVFRNKVADSKTFVSWHQDTTYSHIGPLFITCCVAITPSTVESGCLRIVPGSHKWGQLVHKERYDPNSMLTRGHYIAEEFDDSTAVDIELRPGEAVLIYNGVVHGSPPNRSSVRRMHLLIDTFPTTAVKDGARESAMLIHGVDAFGNFELEEPPQEDYGPAEIAAHRRAVEMLAVDFYAGSDRKPEALSGQARNVI